MLKRGQIRDIVKLVVREISIGAEVLGQENERRNVSTMEIKLEKKD